MQHGSGFRARSRGRGQTALNRAQQADRADAGRSRRDGLYAIVSGRELVIVAQGSHGADQIVQDTERFDRIREQVSHAQ